jgi:hypothetical protein
MLSRSVCQVGYTHIPTDPRQNSKNNYPVTLGPSYFCYLWNFNERGAWLSLPLDGVGGWWPNCAYILASLLLYVDMCYSWRNISWIDWIVYAIQQWEIIITMENTSFSTSGQYSYPDRTIFTCLYSSLPSNIAVHNIRLKRVWTLPYKNVRSDYLNIM